MSTRAGLLALPLGVALALVIAACGSSENQESGANVAPPLTAQSTAPPTTAATTATTTVPATTTTAPATTTTPPPATTPTATQPSGGATTKQPTTGGAGGAPAGCPSAIGGFIRDVRATDCGVARSVATAWFAAVRGGAAPDSAVDAAGYSCSGTLAGERASVSCTGSGGSVSFTASP